MYGDAVCHSMLAAQFSVRRIGMLFHLQLLMKMEAERQAYEFNTIGWIEYSLKLNDFYK